MLKVVIADDHAMMREGLRRIIDDSGNMTVMAEAADAIEALEQASQHDCDLLLMDMSMPGMTGIELIQKIRLVKPALPILVMSMHDTGLIAAGALKAGANGYITKNTDPERFPSIIARIAEGGRYIDPVIANSIIFAGANEPQPHEQLSEREKQILQMIVAGKSIKGIASELFISPKTVTTHKKRLMEKLDIQNNADLVRYSLEHQLGTPSD
ncbi:MAG: DNA-binding response regulator [Burkholderiaceae bacterium]|nr:DNA-binding response regulator [Burkholderiaceae bacterium]